MGEGWADSWNPLVVGSVILGTDFGKVWLWRLSAVVVLLAVLTFTRGDRWVVVAILAAIALGSLGLVGHAVMRSGTFGWLIRLSFVAHVFWRLDFGLVPWRRSLLSSDWRLVRLASRSS
jgi:copper resistance protein D